MQIRILGLILLSKVSLPYGSILSGFLDLVKWKKWKNWAESSIWKAVWCIVIHTSKLFLIVQSWTKASWFAGPTILVVYTVCFTQKTRYPFWKINLTVMEKFHPSRSGWNENIKITSLDKLLQRQSQIVLRHSFTNYAT